MKHGIFTTLTLLVLLSLFSIPTTPAYASPVSVTVIATNGSGTPTGVNVNVGQTLTIQASGFWCSGGIKNDGSPSCGGPEGIRPANPGEEVDLVLPNQLIGLLIGRIGSWVFPIGANAQIISQASGQLYLLMNDRTCCYADNSGQVTATIQGGGGGAPPTLIDYKQNRDASGNLVPWGANHLYDISTCSTMAQEGCAITSLTDILASYGLMTLPNGASTDPGTVNHYFGLSSNAGTHSGCGIIWSNAARAVNFAIHDYRPPTTSYENRIARINEALNANNLVIVGFPNGSGKHFVVFYQAGPNAPDGSPDYFIADPYRYQPYATGDRSGKTLYQAYNKTLKQMASSFQVEVVDNKAPQPGRSWAIVAHSPIEMLITDPNGQQTGFDPGTNSYMLNIPDSSYGPGDGLEDDTGTDPALPDVLYFGQNQLEVGRYIVQVVGTGSGAYELDFAIASGPMDTSVQSILGTASPGVIDTYLVNAVEGQSIGIQLQVKIDIKPDETPNSINVKSTGLTPVAILSTLTFDVKTIPASSVRFGPEGASAVKTSIQDVNGDGLLDLVMQFKTQQIGIKFGDTQACLIGKTKNGLDIQGCDQIRTIH